MEELPRQELKKVVLRFGQSVIDNPQRCTGLLRDYFGNNYRRELNVLSAALREQVPRDLLAPPSGYPMTAWISKLVQRLVDNLALSEDAALWAVESWALALGVLDAPLSRPQVIVQPSRVETPTPPPSPFQAGNNLSIVLAPGIEMAFVRVPGGEFLMGSDTKIDTNAEYRELPQHKVYLDEYLIGKYPVTNKQYYAFVKATAPSGWDRGAYPQAKEHHPVVNVSWEDAAAFCEWASKASRKTIRLPSDAEWEKAARGSDGRIYPWGNQKPDKNFCNFNMNIKDTTLVGQYSPKGDSPYGCADMAGNVWEWTNSLYKGYPYQAGDGREERGSQDARFLRGGSFIYDFGLVRCAYRFNYYPYRRVDDIGFRVCASPISNL